ncbi:MAG: exosortase/archaeosortase family protein, partial [Phycisphaeraceae bacterium]|nr:exosortase/archaeosortase family protein [Phycisphaeraceae bacterium]
MLAAFVALGVAVAFLADRSWWQRGVMVALTIPIAVMVNVGRVTVLGLVHLVNKQWAEGDMHTFVGMLMLIPALLSFLWVGWVLDRIIIKPEIDPVMPLVKVHGEPTLVPRMNALSLLLGFISGCLLALLVGLAYGLFLACFRPGLLGSWFSRPVVGALFVGVGILIVLGIVFLRSKLLKVKPATRHQIAQAICCGVLVCAVSGLTYIIGSTKSVLIKKPVQMRQPLIGIPQKLGNWEMVLDERLTAAVLEELRTEFYISRQYRDVSVPLTEPGSTIRFHVAYYTGTPDTVPHVPERCFVAAGL